MRQLKSFIKELTPPIIFRLYRSQSSRYGFFGNYQSWQDAKQKTTGYNDSEIQNKVKKALLAVKQGQAVYERDSVLFERIYYPFPLLSGLLRIAAENQGRLCVLDFGGSLGSSYYQCKDFLSVLQNLSWNIVEQAGFVRCGKEFFEDEQLKFFYDIDACLKAKQPDVILLSSVIQYLETPYDFLRILIEHNFKYIIFDRTAFVKEGRDRLTIQKVPPEIYPASYPSWFFNLEKFLNVFTERYDLIFDFDALDVANIPSQYKGFFFKRKETVQSQNTAA
ncbi:methyltransferase, TIGR04325 family [Kovacikia minuta CCNUW1]|uniref:TIGR04325 family methyltransferase n=1 Tax=Kovacikia minuta TaxID=2931930 RepID=UPI001CCF1069|nr:TIGR04325 family methyltransferase [Kovacikia minuta]UBF24682.1 methyltransferase, TIGR04325 family [Kovacikia minuta CCNUW1]